MSAGYFPNAASEAVPEERHAFVALANALLDVKVCAVDDIWSGLKLVIKTGAAPGWGYVQSAELDQGED